MPQAVPSKEFADDFYVNPSYCTLPPIPANDGIPNVLNSTAVCLDRATGESARSARHPSCLPGHPQRTLTRVTLEQHAKCTCGILSLSDGLAGQPSVAEFDLVGTTPSGTITVGQAQVFVTYQRRLYMTFKFMCR